MRRIDGLGGAVTCWQWARARHRRQRAEVGLGLPHVKFGMRQSDDPGLDAMLNKPRRCVALRRDDDDTFQPEDSIAFRSHDAKALRKVCAFLRWKIVSDTSQSQALSGLAAVMLASWRRALTAMLFDEHARSATR
jgi:hypothetical protein